MQVVRSPAFIRELEAIVPASARVDQMLDGVEWVLARTPQVHAEAPGSDLRVAVTQFGDPKLRVFYRWKEGDTVVSLEHVDVLP